MSKALIVALIGVAILAMVAIAAIGLRQRHDVVLHGEIEKAREMTFLVCERALPYVMGGSQGIEGKILTFDTISTNETGGYKILLCTKK